MKNPSAPEVVVITGASAGVGRSTVREFARRGARIGLLTRGREGLEAARREVEAAGGRALVLPADVADAAAVEAAAETVEHEFGPIDIWSNNAMVSVFSPIKEMTAEHFPCTRVVRIVSHQNQARRPGLPLAIRQSAIEIRNSLGGIAQLVER